VEEVARDGVGALEHLDGDAVVADGREAQRAEGVVELRGDGALAGLVRGAVEVDGSDGDLTPDAGPVRSWG
jgi:hypothetical protein